MQKQLFLSPEWIVLEGNVLYEIFHQTMMPSLYFSFWFGLTQKKFLLPDHSHQPKKVKKSPHDELFSEQ
ncbi:hypothetical protein DPP16_05720 [Salmonella enterica subsp. salamae serovar Sofia]|nr:hypothetical protein [Salmonella enterica subsp. salamae serovar Sofia]